MAVRDSYLDYILEQLQAIRPVSWRRMFGGIGLYADGVFFAVIDNDVLYFRTGDSNRPVYEARGMRPFQPMGPDTKPMAYHEVPGEILENRIELAPWMTAALFEAMRAPAAARRKRQASPGPKVKAPVPASTARTPRRPRPPTR